MSAPTLGLVCCAAGGLEHVRDEVVKPFLDHGWAVAVTATPTAATWMRASGELQKIEALTGYPVRHQPRLPDQLSPHPDVDCYAVVPATANTVAKLALGIADNQALTQVCEAIGARQPPVVVFPRVNAAHAGHPAWDRHLSSLADAGVHLIRSGEPSHQPPDAPGQLPWKAIRQAIKRAVEGGPAA